MGTVKSAWISNAKSDLAFIIAPPFLALLAVFLFPQQFKESAGIPVFYWVILILMIDVAHVYTTLYQTYFNPSQLNKHRTLYLSIPILCYIGGVLLHTIDGMLFWSILAYLAVYHFIRQQYGFMRLYSRADDLPNWTKQVDTISIYSATIYPLLFWHLSANRNFNWFVDGEFLSFQSEILLSCISVLYVAVIVFYAVKELYYLIRFRSFNLPKNLIILGTYLSWYFGIVYFNGDMAFTTLNVISHGIPYMALVWFMQLKNNSADKSLFYKPLKSAYGILLFTGSIILLAYLEEGLWDGFIWRDHPSVFNLFKNLPSITNKETLALLVPFLSLPQSTHYVLDGFIWKRNH
ncbi:hypothetical protein NF867_04895 [Solitalea sp. MAHUQ-68]|uniref:Uncharacterized protein n=1 Tax=Solitalea agri TaxID=2953739 RepID=A0A9X2F071_9SPHI|nr:hypothetical protein [Solitalea agri]MCO4292197.1 hypothetical protein [Solitalea agri]